MSFSVDRDDVEAREFADDHPRRRLLARPIDGDDEDNDDVEERRLFRSHIAAVARAMVDTTHTGGTPGRIQQYVGAFHDFGKTTAYFQEYIRHERGRSKWTNHSALGALAVFYALEHAEDHVSPVEQVMAWYAIHRHHGIMINLTECYERAFDMEQLSIYHDQVDALRPYADMIEDAYASIGITFDVDGFAEWVESNQSRVDIFGALDYGGDVDPALLPHDSAYQVIDAYGRLIGTDRLDASGYEPPDRRHVPPTMVEQYATASFDRPEPGSINALREAGRNTAETALRDVWSDGNLPEQYTLTLPTGLGKTLTGSHSALLLRDRLDETTLGDPPRIVYVLPYTAIIDQVADVLAEVYETATGRPADPMTVLKQHHLSPGYHDEDAELDAEYSPDELTMFGDRWDSEVVVTTYVQLIEGLLTPTPSQGLRFPNLSPAIFVLDEPQSLPSAYWRLIDDTLAWLTEQWDVYTISMTATHPRLEREDDGDEFEDGTNTTKGTANDAGDEDNGTRPFIGGVPLIPHPEAFHDRLDRVRYRVDASVHGTPLSINEWTAQGLDHATEHPDDNVLLICNTLRAAETVHDLVDDAVGRGELEGRVRYLSSNVRPVDRARRIAELTNDDDGNGDNRAIIVSTQVVETGVDLDVDYILRDMAPADTLVQAAGRCNRNDIRGGSTVDVARMRSLTVGHDSPAMQIYDRTKLDMTERVLPAGAAGGGIAESTMVDELLPAYFNELAAQPGLDVGVDQIQAWAFNAGRVTLIDDEDEYQIYVVRTATDQEILEGFVDAIEAGNRLEQHKADVYERVVSTRESQIDTDALARGAADPENDAVRLVSENRRLYAISGPVAAAWYDGTVGLRLQ